MSYRADLPDDVVAFVRRLPPPVGRAVAVNLARLEERPVQLSRPAFAPLPASQKFEFEVHFEDMDYYFTVLFQYGADELTLHVIVIDLMTV